MARAEELRGQYRRCIEELTAAQLEVERLIETLEPREREIFRLRYIDGAKWEDICVIMSYSWRQVHRRTRRRCKSWKRPKRTPGKSENPIKRSATRPRSLLHFLCVSVALLGVRVRPCCEARTLIY